MGGPRPLLLVFELRGAEGRLAADSSPPRGGSRFYDLDADLLFLEAPGMRASVSTKGRLTLMAREGPSLETGTRLSLKGGTWLEGGLLVAGSLADSPSPSAPARLRHRLRSAFLASLGRAGGGGASSGLLEALLAGRRDELDAGEALAFKKAGCAHVLSLSGQHLSILAAAAALLLKPLVGPLRARNFALLLVLLFVFIAGSEPALLRSLLMYALAALALLVDRPQEARGVLGLSFALQLLLDPAGARGLSFALSYLAMAGLVVLTPRFDYLLLPLLPPKVSAALAASLAAQAATTPLCALVFGAVYPIGIIASILTAPLVALFLWWGLLASLLCLVLPVLAVICGPVSLALHFLLEGAMAFFARAPSLSLDAGARGLAALAVVLGSLFVYALPHAEHHRGLRLLPRPSSLSRGGGAGHVQATRPELPREP